MTSFLIQSGSIQANDVDAEVRKLMGWLDTANPTEDAKKSIETGDERLLSVIGIVRYIPGVDQKDYQKLADSYGLRDIEGTSDGLVSKEHKRLNDLARKYAKKYNEYVINNVKK